MSFTKHTFGMRCSASIEVGRQRQVKGREDVRASSDYPPRFRRYSLLGREVAPDSEAASRTQAFAIETLNPVLPAGWHRSASKRGAAGGLVRTPTDSEWNRYQAIEAPIVRSVVGARDTFNGARLPAHWMRGLSVIDGREPAAALASRCPGFRSSSILGAMDTATRMSTDR